LTDGPRKKCIVLATRPLLMCLLRNFLEQRSAGKVSRKEITEPIKALLKASRESATKSLAILAVLQSQQLLGQCHRNMCLFQLAHTSALDVFVPFDLESTFACAFVLSLMSTLPSVPAQDIFYVDKSFAILNYMIQRGNRVAEYRKGELENLFGFLEALRNSTEQVDQMDHGDNTTESAQTSELTVARTDSASIHPSGPGTDSLQSTLAPLNGLSPDTMLSIAGLLDWQPPEDDFLKYPSSTDWLWTEPHDLHYSGDTGSNVVEDTRPY
jgi:proline utilization trans-activator